MAGEGGDQSVAIKGHKPVKVGEIPKGNGGGGRGSRRGKEERLPHERPHFKAANFNQHATAHW